MKTLLISSLLLYLLFTCGDQSGANNSRMKAASCGSASETSVHNHPQQILVAVWLGNSVMLRVVSFNEKTLHFDPNQKEAKVNLPRVVKVSARETYPEFPEEY